MFFKIVCINCFGDNNNNNFVQFCKENSIKCHQSYTSIHASFVERFKRTIRNRIYSYMDSHNTQRFVGVLQDIISAYNHTNHRMIGTTLAKAELKDNHNNIRENLQQYYSKFSKQRPKYKVRDNVKITVLGNKFHRVSSFPQKEPFMTSFGSPKVCNLQRVLGRLLLISLMKNTSSLFWTSNPL